ncbi:unnamed protein product [Tuber aestivum]|uniref:RRM domain-containing protein n=1 Tax=Tuber aestivum TaxID=59557 RepID=A0A292Q7D4_9PEZI|nr:unnamed protein product [Tuber aestivum]
MSQNSAIPVTPRRSHIKRSPRSLSANLGANRPESSSEDEVDLPSTPQTAGLPGGALSLRRRGKTMSSLEDGDDPLPSFLHSVPLNLGGESNRQFSRVLFNQSREVEIKDSESDNDTEFFAPHEDNPITLLPEANLQITQANIDFETLEAGIERGPEDLAARGLPSACVFVANLAATQSDEELMKSLQAHFSKFGRLHVKIRRDSKGNPYSFCQFETDEVARKAIREGRARIIDSSGRPIRCEPAKVNRTLVLGKSDSSIFHGHEVVDMLHGFGPLESVEFTNGSTTMPLFGLTSGNKCYVRFQFRQDAVDSFQSLRLNSHWVSDWTSNFSAQNMSMALRCDQHTEIDAFSIFVGKLNPQITDNELRARFSAHGKIIDCNLVKRQAKQGTASESSDICSLLTRFGLGINTFAFIRYETEKMADTAIAAEQREIHYKPQTIGIPAGHRYKRETSLTTEAITEPEVPNKIPQYPLVQQYQFQGVSLAPTLHYSNSIHMDQMDPERHFSIASPVIPVIPQFHVMNYHNHYGSHVMASRHPGNFPVAPHPYPPNSPTGYPFPPYTPYVPQYHNPGQGYNFPNQELPDADEMHGNWGAVRQQRISAGHPSVISEAVSPRTKAGTLKLENLTDANFNEASNPQPFLSNEYPTQQPTPVQSHYEFYSGSFPQPQFPSGYPFAPATPALADIPRDSVMSIGYDPATLQYVGPRYPPYASSLHQQQYPPSREGTN